MATETREWILNGERLRSPDGLWKPYRRLRDQALVYDNYILTVDRRLIPQGTGPGSLRMVDTLLEADKPVDNTSREYDIWKAYKDALKVDLQQQWDDFVALCTAISDNEYVQQFYNNDTDKIYVRESLIRMERLIL